MTSRITTLVGISGKMRHGKDALCERFMAVGTQMGYSLVRRAFADALKEECAELMLNLFSDKETIPTALYGGTGIHIMSSCDTVENYESVRHLLGKLLPIPGTPVAFGLGCGEHICDMEGSEILLDWYLNDLPLYVHQFGIRPVATAHLHLTTSIRIKQTR